MTTDLGILDDIRDSIDDGATLEAVTSTDDRLVLVLDHDQARSRYRLDANATRHLLATDLVDPLATASARRPEALVQG